MQLNRSISICALLCMDQVTQIGCAVTCQALGMEGLFSCWQTKDTLKF